MIDYERFPDMVRFKDEPRGKFYIVDLSDHVSRDAHGRLWRNGAIGNLFIRKPHKVQAKINREWVDIKLEDYKYECDNKS